MAFKMKGKPMHMGTTAYKSALKKETVGDGLIQGLDGKVSKKPSSGKPDWSTAPKNNTQARIDWYKKHNLKLDSTTTLKTDTKDSKSPKETSKPKNTSKAETKKVDASGDSKLDKIARGETQAGQGTSARVIVRSYDSKLDYRNAEDRKKMTHKEIFKQKQAERRAKRKLKSRNRAKGKTLRAAIDKWRAGGSKGPMPTRSTI